MTDLDVYLPAIVAGDSDAFAHWVAGAEFPLRALLRRYAAVVDVEAVLQEALLRTWQVAPRFVADGKPNGLLRLAQRIAQHLALDFARRHRVALAHEALLESSSELPPPRAPDPFLREALLECQKGLSKKHAAVIAARLTSAGAEPDARLAQRLKMTLNTFLQNVTRARRALAECLERRGIALAEELR